MVRVTSRRGSVEAKSKVTAESQQGVVFMTFHFAEASANILTNPATDPVAKTPEFKVCAVKVENTSEPVSDAAEASIEESTPVEASPAAEPPTEPEAAAA